MAKVAHITGLMSPLPEKIFIKKFQKSGGITFDQNIGRSKMRNSQSTIWDFTQWAMAML